MTILITAAEETRSTVESCEVLGKRTSVSINDFSEVFITQLTPRVSFSVPYVVLEGLYTVQTFHRTLKDGCALSLLYILPIFFHHRWYAK